MIDKNDIMADLYGGGGEGPKAASQTETQGSEIILVDLSEINDYHNHTFEVIDDESMDGLTESYLTNPKVIDPVILRRDEKHGNPYECISGHRRRRAAGKAGHSRIPAILVDMTDDEADIWMVDSNIHTRQNMSLRELCFSLKVKYDALKRAGASGRSDEKLGEDVGKSRATVQRLIALTKLNEALFDLVGAGKITQEAGEIISRIKKDSQNTLAHYLTDQDKIPKISKDQAEEIRGFDKAGGLSPRDLAAVFAADPADTSAPEKFKLTEKDICGWFPPDYAGNAAAIKQLIRSLIAEHFGMEAEAAGQLEEITCEQEE
jgi:ParB family chromosome partitioning protein